MADYTYFGIANEILTSFNEVPFADTTEFDAATGFHLFIKEQINNVLAKIYQKGHNEWPFQRVFTTQVLTIGETDYTSPSAAAKLDWGSFYIDRVYGDENDFTSVTADSGTSTFTITAGSFITKGFEVGMKVRWQNLSANTGSDFTITTLTATVMTVSESVTTISTPDTSFKVENAFPFSSSRKLTLIDEDTYVNNYLENARRAVLTTNYTTPSKVVRENDNNWKVAPIKPDNTYLVRYAYYDAFTELSSSTDVPAFPERHKHILKSGVLSSGNRFRDNVELASFYKTEFKEQVNLLIDELIPFPEYSRYIN